MSGATSQRLDVALVERGLAPSRERAQALVMAGLVYIEEEKALKASQAVAPCQTLSVRGASHPYVSRGALKLEKALMVFPLTVEGTVAIDVGASTGGFTDLLLRRGAQHVFAVDVGYGQLSWKLRNDPRVTVMERTNARYLTPADFPCLPTLAVMDVSFISVLKILPALHGLLGNRGACVSLIKPQFEAGRERVGKKGVVREARVHEAVLEEVIRGAQAQGFDVQGISFSPITGPEGNIEFLLYLRCSGDEQRMDLASQIKQTVQAAHTALRPSTT